MIAIGEIRRADTIGRSGRSLLVWDACPKCGTPRWQYLRTRGTRCQSCAAQDRARENHPVTFDGVGVPRIGDVALSRVLGYVDRGVRYFVACPSCGVPRWMRRSESWAKVCIHCVPKKPTVDTMERKVKKGYVIVKVSDSDPMRVMGKCGWVLEHRLIVARKLGRPLVSGEIVHHVNGVKSDNREGNLQLLTERSHNSHIVSNELRAQIRILEGRVTCIEIENALLRSQLSGMVIPSQAAEDDSSVGVCRDLTGDAPRGRRESPCPYESMGVAMRGVRRN